ncbi:CDIF630_02480 family spore surface protein [Clostridium formicaceticum]|uniref:DUF3787 domain-containing protein n=1 Tax=Clostridium formicaceticum TaxID=1497 RepID=A0AAC9WGJ8_9CLOT|nr:DUF3787 domain-containing protein [Clostridium formicaceticum]AOY76397.1 DUF3787 domain-containing protein [Clostridium formicaceticum]ARE86790.1 hypothetical protein CLFO_11210 [Clostridium formicaceticum]
MSDNKFKEKHLGRTIENHQTASWANMKDLKPVSRVPIPDEIEVKNAKEYVDTNEK